MKPDPAELTAILRSTPGTLRAWLAELPDAWLDAREAEGTFSPRDVVGHLIHAEKTDWMTRVKLILASGTSVTFPPFDRFGFQDALQGRTISALLDEFEALRAANLAALAELALTPEQLRLEGRHPAFGNVTLGQLLATWAVHDLNHIGQIARVMSRRYAPAVGPWKEYLGILNR